MQQKREDGAQHYPAEERTQMLARERAARAPAEMDPQVFAPESGGLMKATPAGPCPHSHGGTAVQTNSGKK